MQVREIINYLEKWAPAAFQESYDNCGLITGTPDKEVSAALICLDVTEAVVEEAIQKGCGLIISHHPVVFNGLKKLTGKTCVERVLLQAIKNDLAIYAIHTNLDNVHNGVNAEICKRLGLTNTRILAPKKQLLKKIYTFCPKEHADKVRDALFEAGAGWIGNYSDCSFNAEGTGTFKGGEDTNPFVGEKGKRHYEPEVKIETIFPAHLESAVIQALLASHPYEEVAYDVISLDNIHPRVGSGMIGSLSQPLAPDAFLQHVKTTMQTGCIRYTPVDKTAIQTVAVCGGSGSFLLPAAISAGVDAFITADFKYHQFFDAEEKILIADVGHYESEQFTISLLKENLSREFPNFAFLSTSINTNPIRYYA